MASKRNKTRTVQEPASEISDDANLTGDEELSSGVRHRWAYVEMLVSSLIGLYASLVLSMDAILIAQNKGEELSCNLSERISCGAVGATWQANLLGFPNSFLGLIAEPIVITVAVAGLGHVRFPRWFMVAAQAVYTIGLLFAYWLFYQSYFVIGKLCPWCLLITVTTTLVFTSMTRINILDGNLGVWAKNKLGPWVKAGVDVWSSVILILLLALAVYVKYIA